MMVVDVVDNVVGKGKGLIYLQITMWIRYRPDSLQTMRGVHPQTEGQPHHQVGRVFSIRVVSDPLTESFC